MARAIARVDPEHPRLPLLYDAIIDTGRSDGWGSTNANAAAMLAIGERLKGTRPGAPSVALSLSEGGSQHTGRLDASQPVAFWSLDSVSALALTAQGAFEEPLLVRADATWLPVESGSQEQARSQGFVVQRSLERVRDGAPSDKLPLERAGQILRFTVGDVVEEHVRVVVPEDRHHVAIAVPIAAGMEPLNPNLATAPPEATPSAGPTRTPSYADYADDGVAFFYDHLPKGTYEFRFRLRAFTPGSYTQPSARAELMYDATTWGTSHGARVEIARE
jgi:uncharacterized protein YfaS (alpha-2-macroglobulin family)